MRVCVITAMRDVEHYVVPYFAALRAWTLAPTCAVFLENDSTDNTLAELQMQAECRSVSTGARAFPREASAERAAHLARIRNMAIELALDGDNWDAALMLDARKFLPCDGLERLCERLRDNPRIGIVAPNVLLAPRLFFDDIWCFRHLDGRSFHSSDHQGLSFEEVAAVGGVMLVRRGVFEMGARYAGTDGSSCDSVPLCAQARTLGFGVAIDRTVRAVSCLDPKLYADQVAAQAEGLRHGKDQP